MGSTHPDGPRPTRREAGRQVPRFSFLAARAVGPGQQGGNRQHQPVATYANQVRAAGPVPLPTQGVPDSLQARKPCTKPRGHHPLQRILSPPGILHTGIQEGLKGEPPHLGLYGIHVSVGMNSYGGHTKFTAPELRRTTN